MQKPNLYIDIDGVLLGKDGGSGKVSLALHAREFLTFALANFDCYWLTSHCKDDAQPVLGYLHPYLPDDLADMARGIRPTTFDVLKTEALRGDFFWLDDQPLASELAWLKSQGHLSRLIRIDTRRRAHDLLFAIVCLQKQLAGRAVE